MRFPWSKRPVKKRSYVAASSKARFADFSKSILSPDAELVPALNTLRARSRDMVRNNSYARRWLQLMQDNIVGAAGFAFQTRAKQPDGNMDKFGNAAIEEAWRTWSTAKVTADGMMVCREACNLAVRAWCRDGEAFVQKVYGSQFIDGFALHFVEADYIDETLNRRAANGNDIRMGVEVDKYGGVVAYHVLTQHPGDNTWNSVQGRKYNRVLAKDMIHVFVKSRPGQTRGEPPMSAVMTDSKLLAGYREAEITHRRLAASKMGFFTSEEKNTDLGVLADGNDGADSGYSMDVEPGRMSALPVGMRFEQFDASSHSTDYADFEKQILRSMAAGLGVSYNALAMDLEGVSYSSIRQGALEERDFYRGMQTFFIEQFLQPVFKTWLRYALDFGDIPLPAAKFDKFYNASKFSGRGWSWVDPQKEINAFKIAREENMISLTQIAAQQGRDVEETLNEIEAEKAMIEAKGLDAPPTNV